jgi:hypothetical protein
VARTRAYDDVAAASFIRHEIKQVFAHRVKLRT